MAGSAMQYFGDDNTIDQGRKVKTVIMWNGSGGSIAAGVPVSIDLSVTTKGLGRSIKPGTAFGCVGAVVRTSANLAFCEVQVEGRQDLVVSTGAIAAGAHCECNASAQLITMGAPAAATSAPVAKTLAAATGGAPGTVSVEWLNHGEL